MDKKSSEISNYMEILVEQELDNMIEKMGVCKCDRCRLDIKALALNSLKPKYIVTGSGKLYTKISLLQQQFEVDVLSAITKAILIVKEHPRHED